MENVSVVQIDTNELFNKVKRAIMENSNVKSSRDSMVRYLDLSKLSDLESQYSNTERICMTPEFNMLKQKYNVV